LKILDQFKFSDLRFSYQMLYAYCQNVMHYSAYTSLFAPFYGRMNG